MGDTLGDLAAKALELGFDRADAIQLLRQVRAEGQLPGDLRARVDQYLARFPQDQPA